MSTAPKLTIGTVVYDDYDGLYFSLQSIRLYHPEVLNDVEFVIVDNNPRSVQGKAVKDLMGWIKQPHQYIPFDECNGTAVRDLVFRRAQTEYALCMDCHVMFAPGSLAQLLAFYREGKDEGNLLQGPLIYDDLTSLSTHFNPVWRDRMWGVWATDERGRDPNGPPFEIPMQGLGVFACRKNAWLGFNPHFRGFGGEEGYIHEKYRRAGRKTLCLPFLRWMHRFGRPSGIPYAPQLSDRIINYFIGHLELGMDCALVREHFQQYCAPADLARMEAFARTALGMVDAEEIEPAHVRAAA